MDDCLFCKIVKGEVAAEKVYEDEKTLAFLDIFPINFGHTLVIPKAHESEFHHMSEDDYRAVFDTVRKIAGAIERAEKPKRVGLMVQGWEVPHAHVHVVPMNDHGDVTSKKIIHHTRGKPTHEELTEEGDKIRAALV